MGWQIGFVLHFLFSTGPLRCRLGSFCINGARHAVPVQGIGFVSQKQVVVGHLVWGNWVRFVFFVLHRSEAVANWVRFAELAWAGWLWGEIGFVSRNRGVAGGEIGFVSHFLLRTGFVCLESPLAMVFWQVPRLWAASLRSAARRSG